jgi:uncharacterized membrane protein
MKRNETETYYAAGFVAAALAASAAYLLDPSSGKGRRALLREQVSRAANQLRDFSGKAGRDAQKRTRGLYEESISRLRRGTEDSSAEDNSEEKIVERVRAQLGRLSSHPAAIEVSCSNGEVRLTGDILEEDVGEVLRGIERVRGVSAVVNELRVHDTAGNIPALQGESARRTSRFEYMKSNWSPAPRLLAGVAGAAMIVLGLGRRSAAGTGLAASGGALLVRSICNVPLAHLLGIRTSDADGVLVQKTLDVYAEVDEVYSHWRDLESFPAFMTHIREVRKIDDTHYHWTVDGPAGVPVEWDAQITADVPGELIAWRTVEGSTVQSSGVVQFEPTNYGGTRIHVRMSYRPPANVAGHTVAKLFGRDPKRQIDTDLMRFKTFIESGATAGNATRH